MNLIKKLVLVMGVITSLVFSVFGMKFGSKGSLVCSYSLEENSEKLYEYYLKYGETKTLALIKEISDDELLPFDKFRLTKSYQYMQVVMGAGEGRVCMGFSMYTLRNGNQLPAHDYLLVPVEDVPIGYDLKVKLTDACLSDGEVECKGVWSDSQMYLYATELDLSIENDWYMEEIIDIFWKDGIDPMRRWIVLQGKKERIYGYGSFRLSLEGTNLVSDKIYLCGTYGEFSDKLYTTKAAFRGITVQHPDCFFEYSRNGADSISWVFSFWNDFGTDGIETFSIKTPGAGTLVVEESWGETMIHEKCERAKVFNIPTDGTSNGFLDSFTRIAFFPANVRSVEIAAFFGEPEVIESGSGTNDEIISNVDIYRGFVTGTGVYKAGEVTTLRAISGPGQVFDRWDIPKGVSIPNGFEATNPNLSFVVPDDWCGTELEAKRIFLTAHWAHNPNAYIGAFDEVDQKIKVSVRFEPMGGEVTPMTRLVESESNIGALPTPTRSKYKFLGWYTAPEGGTKISATTKVTGDVTYYAQWVYDGSVTVSAYVADGCEAMGKVTGGKTAKIGTKVTLTATANSGYVFSHWEGPLGDGIDSRNPSISFVVGEDDVEFVARFIPEQVKVNFHPNEGFSPETIRDVLKGCAIGVLPVPVRSGYAFIGWYTAKAGGTKVTADTKVSANVTYYARWEILSFKLVLHKNDGTGTSKEISVKYGSPVVLPGAAKTLKWAPRRGFAFMGWATSEKSKNVFLKDQTKVTTSLSSKDTLHVYAIWQLKTASSYAIQYIRNDGSGSVRTIGFNGGVATKLNSVKALGFERRGYTFVGWATSTENARAKKVWKKDMGVVSQPVANGKLLKVYATWKLAPGYYSIRFNKNDGSGKWRELGYKYGENTTLPTIANGLQWSRAGYTFGGWATSAANAAKGIVWRGDKGVTRTPIAAGKTLNVYAIWKKTGATVAAVNRTFEQSTADQTSHASVENALMKLLPGYYSGELADGSGTYNLLVDEGGETGYVQIVFDDASAITETVNVCFLGNVIVVIDEFGMTYNLVK